MIKAYHTGSGIAVNEVLGMGAILPASMRLEPAMWLWDCQNSLENLLEAVSGSGAKPNRHAIGAIEEISHEQADRLLHLQKSHGIRATQTRTEFTCLDMLAGDLDYVFLSLGNWVDWGRMRPSGFVFDAEQLIEDGALIRYSDLALKYSNEVEAVLNSDVRSIVAAKRLIMEGLEAVAHEGTFSSMPVSPSLRELAAQGGVEILWPGSLPIAGAMEIWKDGQQTEGRMALGSSPPSIDPRRLFFFWDLEKDLREAGALVAVSPVEWHNHRRGSVEGWRGPGIESEDFSKMMLQSFSCLKDIGIDEAGFWFCPALRRQTKGIQ